MNFIGRFERLNEDWARIAKEIDVNPLLPHRNASKRVATYRDYYDDESRAMVQEFYKEDLENFNYEY